MKTETIEMLIEKGMKNGAFDIGVARILNDEGVNLTFTKEGIRWKLESQSQTQPQTQPTQAPTM